MTSENITYGSDSMSDNLRMIQCYVYSASSDGKPIEGTKRPLSLLYNNTQISDVEVAQLIDNDSYEFDDRVVVIRSNQFDLLCDKVSSSKKKTMYDLLMEKFSTPEGLAAWLTEVSQYDNSPWGEWFGSKFCDNCEAIKVEAAEDKWWGPKTEIYAYCELNNCKCRFFPDLESNPDEGQTIRLWLAEEVNEDA